MLSGMLLGVSVVTHLRLSHTLDNAPGLSAVTSETPLYLLPTDYKSVDAVHLSLVSG